MTVDCQSLLENNGLILNNHISTRCSFGNPNAHMPQPSPNVNNLVPFDKWSPIVHIQDLCNPLRRLTAHHTTSEPLAAGDIFRSINIIEVMLLSFKCEIERCS